MNYLAHFYLSKESEGLIIGNFIADFVKGKKYLDYAPDIVKGIQMHREIDHYTDQHPIVLQTKSRLYPLYHKYAAVIVDVYYDHILASNWERYSATGLKDYTRHIYGILKKNKAMMPEAARHTLTYMIRYNWLYNYSSLWGTERTLFGLSRRTSFKSNMEKSVRELKSDYELIAAEFHDFFVEIQQHFRE